MFQSLSGFQVRCNLVKCQMFPVHMSWFQSLSGFQVRCNDSQRRAAKGSNNVSIPVGFSSPLQPVHSVTVHRCIRQRFNPCRVFKSAATPIAPPADQAVPLVSIPVGFSSPLQPRGSRIAEGMGNSFQSLSGFQVRCNTEKR